MDAIPLPNRPKVEDLGNNKYRFVLEPLYPGYGTTIGNALRRVLLSSMPGAAVTAVKIKYADHEFSTIPNVKEDAIQIVLNLKQLRLKSFSAEPVKIYIKEKGEKVVTAADIKQTDQIEVVNPELHIATLDSKNSDFEMEITVEQGRGYKPVEMRENHKQELGVIAVDALFSPVKSVYFDVKHVRVGQMTNYDRLEVVLETDGSVDGSEAIDITAHILVDHFTMMFSETSSVIIENTVSAQAEETQEAPALEPSDLPDDNEILASALSNRSKNALIKNGITSLGALSALTDDDIRNLSGLGEKSIKEILEFLKR
ncbi:MAG: DNA-directed RNA polymerase subunit alpha [Candidatus Doudnabacteria bacterium]|nr:DNA-directed RNA polymerase subunit alpha [Candidatus Doudnabacteria bacterium]